MQFCRDVHCRDTNHQNDIDDYIAKVLNSVQEEAKFSLPTLKPSSNKQKAKKAKPGWSDQVQPYRDNAHFWNQVWKSADCPINTVLHNIMKRSRNVYHYQYRKCTRAEETIKKNKLLDACINGDGDLFEQIKAMRKSAPVSATTMDGVKSDIPGHFRGIYSKLYNSHDDQQQIDEISSQVHDRINISKGYT